jgi:SNF2 family DNA or RNA helicase
VPFIVYHGAVEDRRKARGQINRPVEVAGAGYAMRPVVLTTYETVVRDGAELNRFGWASIIVDEGHRLKNHEARLSVVMRKLTSGNRFLLTGTPLQVNHPKTIVNRHRFQIIISAIQILIF